MKHPLLLLFFLLVVSCKQEIKVDKVEQNFDWLNGSWVFDDGRVEKWVKLNKYSYKGMVYESTDGFANIAEYLRFYKLDDLWHYEATVPDQNKGKGITFDEVKSDDHSFTVQNEKHDFPKTLQYELTNDSLIEVTLNKELEKEFSFKMKRHQVPLVKDEN